MENMINFLNQHDYQYCVDDGAVLVRVWYTDGTFYVEKAHNMRQLRAVLGY